MSVGRAERLEELRLQRFRTMVENGLHHTPYWKELMDAHGIQPASIRSLADLARFPLLEKNTLREKRELMVWRGEGKRLQMVRTSGSTNEALEFYTSSTREAHINAARMRGHEWVGIRRGEKELYYWGSPVELSKQDRIKRVRDWLINDGLTNGFEVTPERLKGYYQQWLDLASKMPVRLPKHPGVNSLHRRQPGVGSQEIAGQGSQGDRDYQ